MHERSLANALVRRVVGLAGRYQATRVRKVTVRLGSLSHGDAQRLQDFFTQAARRTPAEGATLEIVLSEELSEVTLDRLELDVAEP